MKIDKERLLPSDTLLVQFGSTKVFPTKTITLLVTIGAYPQQLTKEVIFLVVNYSSTYNAIIGWPTLNAWRVATSTYHLLVKFPTKYEIREVRRNHMVAHKCYVAMLEMDDHLQVLNIERWRVMVELTGDLKEISLDNDLLGRITGIDMQADPTFCKELTLFFKNNQDVFA